MIILYTHITLHAGLTKHRNNRHEKLIVYTSICYIESRIGWVSMKEVYRL